MEHTTKIFVPHAAEAVVMGEVVICSPGINGDAKSLRLKLSILSEPAGISWLLRNERYGQVQSILSQGSKAEFRPGGCDQRIIATRGDGKEFNPRAGFAIR